MGVIYYNNIDNTRVPHSLKIRELYTKNWWGRSRGKMISCIVNRDGLNIN